MLIGILQVYRCVEGSLGRCDSRLLLLVLTTMIWHRRISSPLIINFMLNRGCSSFGSICKMSGESALCFNSFIFLFVISSLQSVGTKAVKHFAKCYFLSKINLGNKKNPYCGIFTIFRYILRPQTELSSSQDIDNSLNWFTHKWYLCNFW